MYRTLDLDTTQTASFLQEPPSNSMTSCRNKYQAWQWALNAPKLCHFIHGQTGERILVNQKIDTACMMEIYWPYFRGMARFMRGVDLFPRCLKLILQNDKVYTWNDKVYSWHKRNFHQFPGRQSYKGHSTDLYTKSTDSHLYLHYSSFHPKHQKQNLPYSQALQLCRICSTKYLLSVWFQQSTVKPV